MAKKFDAVDVDTLPMEECRKSIGPNLSFAASEAYKLLRTNLSFSLPENNKCRVVGITSALAGEGKSTTALNLAYTIGQEGKRVLLIEGDLRLPNVARRLGLRSRPGLSNLLVGQCTGNETLQRSPISKQVYVMAAGDIPPNPAELLNSPQMQETIKALSQVFDMVILDLPPVTVVSDALIASRYMDGMLVVVRQKYCDKKALADLVRKMKFADARILGFVMTDSDIHKKAYKSYRKNHYYHSYHSYYEKAANTGKPVDKI